AGAAAFIDEPAGGEQLRATLARMERMTQTPARRVALVGDPDELDPKVAELLAVEDVRLERIEPSAATAALHAEPFDLAVVVVGRRRAEAFSLLRGIATDEPLREL